MRVFIGMETSGRSRTEFARRGHDVISCDVLPQSDVPGAGRHIVGDVFATLERLHAEGWWPDFALFHPTCTFLTYSAEWAYGDGPYHQAVTELTLVGKARREARARAIEDCERIVGLDIERIVLENPKGAFDRRSPGYQIVQPYMFGDDASKETHLHVVRTAPLVIPQRARWYPPRMVDGLPRWGNQSDSGQNVEPPGDLRWQIRSETYPGLARAFGENWA